MSPNGRTLATCLPAGAVSSTASLALTDGWTLLATDPEACGTPADLPTDAAWRPARVPGTVASSIGPDDPDAHADYDASDWWYRCSFAMPDLAAPGRRASQRRGVGREASVRAAPTRTGERVRLRLDGLATLAEVWLNGARVLDSTNMFCAHEVDVTDLVGRENRLEIVFRSLGHALGARRPRPRWKTRLVESQQLRWFRTTLLGRIPGWTPQIRPVGPWRSVWLERVSVLDVAALHVRADLVSGVGIVRVTGALRAISPDTTVDSVTMCVDGHDFAAVVEATDDGWTLDATAELSAPAPWWPRTHGDPVLYECALDVATSQGTVRVDCGRVGFREVRLDRTDGGARFMVNGVPVFCRGSCWTTNDIVSLVGDPERLRRVLAQFADANANMLRIGGTMVYETDDFYRICDELGLMVWQDFMFANMDYPVGDEAFAASCVTEASQQLTRLAGHPSVVAFCGGSEVEQQAAMFGAPREIWSNDFFSRTLPALVEAASPGTPYWPSTPTGGSLPFHVGEGLAHYFGVGAYRRPLDDVRLARVRFTPECLAFSNVPEPANLAKLLPGGAASPHHPAWKAGVPRDTGAGWDFEDVRDHYLRALYDVDPVELRGHDPERYLAVSRLVTGEVMQRVYAEWRHAESGCGGALTWLLNDLRPGAGWGLIDSDGAPKPALHHLRRAWAPRCVRLLDRGLDGLSTLLVNESSTPLRAVLELTVLARGSVAIEHASLDVEVDANSSSDFSLEAVLGHFVDPTYAYRFGPPRHEAVVARLLDAGGACLSEDVYRPAHAVMTTASGLETTIARGPDGRPSVSLFSRTLLYGVRIDVRGHQPDDDYFVLSPGRKRHVGLTPVGASDGHLRGYVEALNLTEAVRLSEGVEQAVEASGA